MREDIRKHNLDEIRETIEAYNSLGKNRMITLLDKQGKEIQEQDKIMARIEEEYSELYDSDQAATIQTYPEEVPLIMAWEVEAWLRKMERSGNQQVNIETLKAGEETIAKQLAKLYTKCITERRIPKTWKEANNYYGDIFQEREQKRHQELQTTLFAIKYVQTVHNNHNN